VRKKSKNIQSYRCIQKEIDICFFLDANVDNCNIRADTLPSYEDVHASNHVAIPDELVGGQTTAGRGAP
jgi:hypothetical protein